MNALSFSRTCRVVLALLWVCGLGPHKVAGRVIDHFPDVSAARARQVWEAKDGSPAVQPTEEGWVFTLPFGQTDRDRVYWDRAVALDLSGESVLRLELTSPEPAALRSLALYLRSGEGWYIWNRPLPGAGRRTLSLMRTDFEAEGRPAGWHQIDAIRLSPWRGQGVDTHLTLHRLEAVRPDIWLVRPARLPDAEREPARRAAARISQWLTASDVPHGILDEQEVDANRLRQAQVIVLPYNPKLTAGFRAQLRAFVERGGQVVVFYSNDEPLARMLGFRLGAYQAAEHPGQWSAMAFVDPAWPVPNRVYQQSWNIRPAHPVAPHARVIAVWEDALGRRSETPAWTASDHGLWMAHILLPGDDVRKRQLLSGLLAHRHPQLWARLAANALRQAGQVGPYVDINAALNALRGAGHNRTERRVIADLLRNAEEQYRRMQQLYQQQRYQSVYRLQSSLQRNLVEAYARAQSPRPGERRGVWDHHGTGLFPGDWDRTAALLAESGINTLYPNLMWGGLAHYASDVLPRSTTYRLHGDQLAQALAAARRHGQEMHVWVVCWNLTGAPADFVNQARREGRLMQDAAGNELPWLNPAHPKNVDLLLASLHEVAANYAIDGIHLDYIRYPNRLACYSPFTQRRFTEWSGQRVRHWPEDVQPGGAREAEFQRFRIEQINHVVRRIHQEVGSAHPDLVLSAAVWGGYPDILRSIAQDWPAWLRADWLDYVVPMNYFDEAARFRHLTQRQLQIPGVGNRVWPGIGVTSAESQLTPDQVILQIQHTRELNLPGWVLFDLNPTLSSQILPALQYGITRDP